MRITPTKERKRPSIILWLLGGILLFGAGLLAGQFILFTSIRETAVRFWQQTQTSGDLPVLTIDIPFTEYDQLLNQREAALAAGVVLVDEADFVPASVRLAGETVPVLLRLRQGPAVHLGPADKWNLDGRLQDGRSLAGFSRFYLLDPADNHWLYEWALGRALAAEGLLANRTQFVQVYINGDDKGVYALQEGFGPELLTARGLPEGVVVEFDTDRLWENAAYFDGDLSAASADPISNLRLEDFRFFPVDTFREAAVADDPVLAGQEAAALQLLWGWQQGDLTAAEVFDVHKAGRFLALIDLWGAVEGLSLANLRYYYNPQSDRLEPIGFNLNPRPEAGRIPIAATFYDPSVQAAYLEALAQYSQPAYLQQLETLLADEWQTWTDRLPGVAVQVPPWQALAERQEMLQRSLDPQQPVLASLSAVADDPAVVQVTVANLLNVPIELLGFDVAGATFVPLDPDWLLEPTAAVREVDGRVQLPAQAGDVGKGLTYVRFQIPLGQLQDEEIDGYDGLQMQVATQVVRQSQRRLTPVLTAPDAAGARLLEQ